MRRKFGVSIGVKWSVLFLSWVIALGLAGCKVEDETGTISIISPVSGATAPINVPETISVSVSEGVSDITLVSSLGTWSATGTNIRTWSGLSGPITVSDTLTFTSVGTAIIQVVDSNNSAVSDVIELYFVTEQLDTNSTVTIQATPSIIAPSTATNESSSSIVSTVRNVDGVGVANARVTFSLSNTTGSGEYLSPPVAYTDPLGVANTTLYAGSQVSSASGVTITANLDETLTGTLVSSSTDVVVGSTVGSISIGMSTIVTSVNNDTAYSLPVSLQVTDSTGNPVANAEVNISLWPERYALGYWACVPSPGLFRVSEIENEDLNKNSVLDLLPVNEDISGDGALTPSSSAAGAFPSTVTTDANGFAVFDITYLKSSAGFVYDNITASTVIAGVETMATTLFWLPALSTDVTACLLGDSPFNAAWPMVAAAADVTTVTVGGSSTITVSLTSQDGSPLANKEVYAAFLMMGSASATAPALTASPQITDASGVTTFTYTAGDQAGTDLIKFYYTSSGVELTDYVTLVAE